MPGRTLIPLLMLMLVGATNSFAQVVTKRALTLDAARHVIDAAKQEAAVRNAPGGVIAVVDDGGNLMALERLDGTFAAGARVSIGKARTAAMFQRPTAFFEEIIRAGRTPMVALEDFTPLQGGVPILVDGEVVGGIGVSGAASAQQDEELAIAGASAVSSLSSANSREVTYIESDAVAKAFAKGAVLVNEGRYMVHASHREAAGMAEVHTLDTDIIYVLRGEAIFVTGGEIVEGETVEPNEIRGRSIAGGTSRRLVPGDVVVVPNGTAHWFESVPESFDYYVVKVR